MLNRFCFGTILLFSLAVTFTGCSNTQVGTIVISPATQSLAAGQTVQFTATGIVGHGAHPASTDDVTNRVVWASSASGIATINSSGVATAVSAGTTTITASMPGAASASATLTVTGSTGTSGGDVVSLSVIPGSQSVANPSQASQFIAIGTTSSGATVDMTNQVAWNCSSKTVATITSTGLATGVGQGTATITAIATNPDKTVATGTATFTVTAGTSEPITALSITPSSESLSASDQNGGQFIAIGTSGTTGLTQEVTNSPQLKWISSIPSVASITSGQSTGNGVAIGASAGTTTISALWTNPDGTVVSAPPATVTVTVTAAPNPLLSLQIIPNSITVGNLQDAGQFLAIGTFSTSPYTRDLTNSVKWLTSAPNVFPVNTNDSLSNSGASAGIATAYGNGSAVIIAEYPNPDLYPDQTIQTATATFSCPLVLPTPTTAGSCFPGSEASALLSTLTIYNEGLNTTNWLVTAPSATDPLGAQTKNPVMHCGPGSKPAGYGDSVCVATYPVGATVTLTAPAGAAAFGGWSYNCFNQTVNKDTNGNVISYTCQVSLTFNDTVGVIFN